MIVGPAVLGLFAGAAASQQWADRSSSGSTAARSARSTRSTTSTSASTCSRCRACGSSRRSSWRSRCSRASARLATQYLYGGLRIGGQRGGAPRTTRAARVHLSVIAAVIMLLIAANYWLDRYSILTKSQGNKFAGASFTDVHAVIPSKAILAGIAIFVAVLVHRHRDPRQLAAARRSASASWSSRRSRSAASTRPSCRSSRCSRTSRTPSRSTSPATSTRRSTRTGSRTSRRPTYTAKVTAEAGALRAGRRDDGVDPAPRPAGGQPVVQAAASRSAASTTSPTRCRSTATRSTARAATP